MYPAQPALFGKLVRKPGVTGAAAMYGRGEIPEERFDLGLAE